MPLMHRTARALLASALCLAWHAYAADAHVHGQGHLDLAVDAGTLTMHLECPLDSFVGFERAPKTAKEREAIRRMAQALRSEAAFIPSPAAKCKLQQVTLSSPVLDPELLGANPSAPPEQHGEEEHAGEGHAEIEGEYVYECAEPSALRAVEVGLFESFKRLKRLDVQVAAPQGQTGARLTQKKRTVAW